MEHQMGSYHSARYMTQQFLQLIKDLSEEELLQLTLTLSTTILKSGLKYVSPKETSIDNRLIFINAQLLVISLCESLNKEIRKLDLDGVNYLEREKQLENRIYYLKETLTKLIQKHIKKMD